MLIHSPVRPLFEGRGPLLPKYALHCTAAVARQRINVHLLTGTHVQCSHLHHQSPRVQEAHCTYRLYRFVVSRCRTLAVELQELRAERARALESRTLAGHAKNALGYAMSAYCVYK